MNESHKFRHASTHFASCGSLCGRHVYYAVLAGPAESLRDGFEELTAEDLAALATGAYANILVLRENTAWSEEYGFPWYRWIRAAHEVGVSVMIRTEATVPPDFYRRPGRVDEEPDYVGVLIKHPKVIPNLRREWVRLCSEFVLEVYSEEGFDNSLKALSEYAELEGLESRLEGVPVYLRPHSTEARDVVREAVRSIALPWGGELIYQPTSYHLESNAQPS